MFISFVRIFKGGYTDNILRILMHMLSYLADGGFGDIRNTITMKGEFFPYLQILVGTIHKNE